MSVSDVEIKFDDREVVEFFKKLTKNLDDISKSQQAFAGAIGAVVFKDVIDHFEREQGPSGKWKKWSRSYDEYMKAIGKGGNKILQDTGRLRQSFAPTNYRKATDGIVFYNNAKTKDGYPYAWAHNEGDGRLPQREFMWLSKTASDNLSKVTLGYLLNGIGD